jgi:hypothetical protein
VFVCVECHNIILETKLEIQSIEVKGSENWQDEWSEISSGHLASTLLNQMKLRKKGSICNDSDYIDDNEIF